MTSQWEKPPIKEIGPNSLMGLKKNIFKFTNGTKTHVFGIFKGSFINMSRWPQNQGLGNHFVAKYDIWQLFFLHFPTKKPLFRRSSQNFHANTTRSSLQPQPKFHLPATNVNSINHLLTPRSSMGTYLIKCWISKL